MTSPSPPSPSLASRLPYRPCAGVMLFNAQGRVWVGRRIDSPGSSEGGGGWWQMPQGGIDADEEPRAAALRELYEETSIRSVQITEEMPDWLIYDLPDHLLGKAWKGRYRGQRIKWFACRFTGDDSEIDVVTPGGGHKPEFDRWRWADLDTLPGLIVPFKRAIYVQVCAAFAHLARPQPA